MTTHNTAGVEYAKITDLRAGDKVNVDDGFICRKGGWATVRRAKNRRGPAALYIPCRHGGHYLDGQCDDGDHCIGITPRT